MKQILCWIAVCLLCSCKNNGQDVIIRVEDGVTIVENSKMNPEISETVHLAEVLTIGDADRGDAYLFTRIRSVAVDSECNIYVADSKECEIRKFTADGKYLATIGRKGQGPGEFGRIGTINLGDKNELLVFDDHNQRLSIFDVSGNFVTSYGKLMADEWISPGYILQNEGGFTLLQKNKTDPELFHVYTSNGKKIGSFGPYQYIDNQKYEDFNFVFSSGNCSTGKNGSIFYTKQYYDNQVFEYHNNQCSKVIKTVSECKKPYEVHFSADVHKVMDMQGKSGHDFYAFGSEAYYGYNYQNSAGVFQLTSGEIVNFVSVRAGDRKRVMHVQIFDESGALIKNVILPGEAPFYMILCKDNRDRFYAVSHKDIPQVVVMTLAF